MSKNVELTPFNPERPERSISQDLTAAGEALVDIERKLHYGQTIYIDIGHRTQSIPFSQAEIEEVRRGEASPLSIITKWGAHPYSRPDTQIINYQEIRQNILNEIFFEGGELIFPLSFNQIVDLFQKQREEEVRRGLFGSHWGKLYAAELRQTPDTGVRFFMGIQTKVKQWEYFFDFSVGGGKPSNLDERLRYMMNDSGNERNQGWSDWIRQTLQSPPRLP